MNIFNLLTKEKHVTGIEIDDSFIRLAFFRPEKRKGVLPFLHSKTASSRTQDITILEETLPENVVHEGVVVDVERLSKILESIWAKAKLSTKYAIVAIPDDQIYLRIFSFPKTVDEERLREAMTIGVSFQLPMKQEDVYLDWEHVPNSDSPFHEVLLSAIPKTVAEGYMASLDLAGIRPLALESHLASIARAVKADTNATTIFTKKTNDDATVFVLKDQEVRFSRSLPLRFIPKTKFEEEVRKIRQAFESELSEGSQPIKVEEIEKAELRDEYASLSGLSQPASKWLVALGAAIRGRIKEGNDHFISLLPIKTEEAYSYQKAATFVVLMRNMTISVSFFFVAAFLGMYFFILSLSQTTNREVAGYSIPQAGSEALTQETLIQNVNELLATSKKILSETPVWSVFLTEINKRIIPGIIISNLSTSSLDGVITMNGTAKSRATLNDFKKSLQESEMFSDVVLPVTNLEQKEDIAFSVSFRLKNPSTLYYQ